jgi:hypothetical protein
VAFDHTTPVKFNSNGDLRSKICSHIQQQPALAEFQRSLGDELYAA